MHTIEEINTLISNHSSQEGEVPQRLSPELGNVCFACAQHGWSFTLESFAQLYCTRHPGAMAAEDLAKRLWGDWYHDPNSSAITKKKPFSSASRTFVQYVLEPVYKIYSQAIGETPEDLLYTLKSLGIQMKGREINLDPKPLLKLALSRFFGYPRGFVEMIVKTIPSPIDGTSNKVSQYYTGYQSSTVAQSMRKCDASGPLVANVVKLFNTPDGNKFLALARIYSGSVSVGQRVRVLGEGFSQEDEEDMAVAEVLGISLGVGRFSIEVSRAIAGNYVLLDGVDGPIKKTATIIDMDVEEAAIFKPLKFDNSSVVKLAVEPLNPSELPKMVEALRRINKSYPLVTTKVEESGEHVILGTGELCMDCVMHDLRHLYSDIEVKVADPVVSFCETVVESSSLKCFAETPNKKNKLTMIAEPLEEGLADDIERYCWIPSCKCHMYTCL